MLLEHSDYLAFRYAASLASSEMMQHIYQVADSAQRRGMMKSKNYSAFGKAITLCNKAMLDMLFYEFSNNVSMRRSLISSNNYSYFRLVSCQKETRDLGSLQTIFDISSDSQRREMLSLEDFKAFNVAADEGLFDLFNIIYTFSKPYQDIWTEIPDRGNYAGFRSSAKNGHLSTLKGIWNWLSEKNANSVTTTSDTQTASKVSSKTVATLQKVLNSNDYLVFCLAAENQHWDVLMQLFGWLDLNEDKVRKELLNSWNYYKSEFPKVDFEKANSFINKGLGIIDQSYHGPSFTTAPAPSHQVGAASSTEATSVIPDSESSSLFVLTEFKNAVTHNHTEILAKMWASANPGQQQMAIETDQFWCLTECIKNNRIDCFKLLWDWTSQEQRNQFLGESKSPLYALIFIEAGELGRTEILQHVYTTSTLEEQCTMLSAENFEAFQASAKNNHLGVVSALVKLLEAQQQPQQPQIDAMLTSNNCQAFLNGIVERKLDLITLIFESATSKEAKKTLIESGSYRPFCIAGENGYTQVLMMLYDWSNSKQAMLKSFDAYVSSLAIRKRDTPQIKKSYEIINKLFKGGGKGLQM